MEENNIIHQARFFRYFCPLPGSLPSRLPSPSPSAFLLQARGRLWEAASGNPGLHSGCSPSPSPRRQTDSSGKEWWVTNNTYWRLRAEPGYGNLDGAVLW